LASYKKSINAQDEEGNTALHRATYNGNTRLVKKLVTRGAKARLKNSMGKSSIDLAREFEFDNLLPFLVQLNF